MDKQEILDAAMEKLGRERNPDTYTDPRSYAEEAGKRIISGAGHALGGGIGGALGGAGLGALVGLLATKGKKGLAGLKPGTAAFTAGRRGVKPISGAHMGAAAGGFTGLATGAATGGVVGDYKGFKKHEEDYGLDEEGRMKRYLLRAGAAAAGSVPGTAVSLLAGRPIAGETLGLGGQVLADYAARKALTPGRTKKKDEKEEAA